MTKIDAHGLGYRELNEELRRAEGEIEIDGCMGQRFIASGMSGKKIKINGIPGNALGAYLDGSEIEVMGNVQDAVGDTMNFGTIAIHGSAGDAVGYAMRGGEIYVRDNAGYRAGIHMKAYADRFPVIVIGGKCGSFLGEYQAGGLIIVLGNGVDDDELIGHFCGTGMHGGRIFLRCREIKKNSSRTGEMLRGGRGGYRLRRKVSEEVRGAFRHRRGPRRRKEILCSAPEYEKSV